MTRWVDYDRFESAVSRAGGELADVLERVAATFGADSPEHAAALEAAKVWTDAARQARRSFYEKTLTDRGHRQS